MIVEKGGKVFVHVFANPAGGPERLSHIDHLVTKYTLPKSTWFADSAKTYVAYCLDNPQMEITLCRVNHNEAKDHGFVWHLFIDDEIAVCYFNSFINFRNVFY